MTVIWVLAILIAPFLVGAVITLILRERTATGINIYATGLLSLFVFFLFCILVALKLDMTLSNLAKIYLIPVAGLCGLGLLEIILRCQKKLFPLEILRLEKKNLPVIISAVLLALFSYVYLAPSYVNDDTWEIVSTSAATNSIYQYSAMTGDLMEKGLPIFNKIYVMPMLYSVITYVTHINAYVLMGLLFPLMAYVLNLLLVSKIGDEIDLKSKDAFMIIYMILLFSGTYLPSKGIPVTVGYAILREGYSGYAMAYGIAVPFALLLLLQKKRFHALCMLVSLLGLVRLDRIFFALKTPVQSYISVNTAGKLVILYLVAIITMIMAKILTSKKIEWLLLLQPMLLVSYICDYVSSFVQGKWQKRAYYLGLCFIFFSCVGLRPFEDAETLQSQIKTEETAITVLNELDILVENVNPRVWGSKELMAAIRRVDGTSLVLYGRDDLNPGMAGLDYEENTGNSQDFENAFINMTLLKLFYPMEKSLNEILNEASLEGCDYLLLPSDALYMDLSQTLNDAGFILEKEVSGINIIKIP